MGKFTIGIHLLAVAGALLGCARAPVEADTTGRATDSATKPAATTRPAKVNITIGKDTTYITGPLNADGTVNYVAYINAKNSKGVTPKNNAAVLLVRAIGPTMWSEDVRAKAMKLMSTPAPPPEGEYFVPLYDYIEHLDEKDRPIMAEGERASDVAADLLDKTLSHPWSARDYPLVAGWLKANAKPLALVESASRCSHIYFPLISVDDPPQWLTVKAPPCVGPMQAGRALVIRAMLRSSQGQAGKAWGDLMAARRLARLISRGATLIESLVGMYIEAVACTAGEALIVRGGLSAAQGRACLADLNALAPLPDIRKTIANERFVGLDTIMAIARTGGRELPSCLTEAPDGNLDRLPIGLRLPIGFNIAIVASCLDWDEMMRVWNGYFDRWHVESTMWHRELEILWVKTRAKCAGPNLVMSRLRGLIEPPARRCKRISRDVTEVLVVLLFPKLAKMVAIHRAKVMRSDVLRIGAALLVHRAETGQFPAKLADLAPKYLKAIPKDRFGNKPLVYRREGKGCLVYSVGMNWEDDGGIDNRYDGVKDDDEKDDIVIRFKR